MIQISQLKLPISHTEADLRQKIKKTLAAVKLYFLMKLSGSLWMPAIKRIKSLYILCT